MKKRLISWIGLGLLATFCIGADSVRAETDPAFARANQAYSEGRFQEAVEGYQSLVQSGRWSANLFYDLGNAWFRAGDFGQAILNYERTLALDPRHPEAEANLQLARDEARALELRKNWIERYLEAGTTTQYSVAAALSLWFAFFLATRLLFSRRRSADQMALIAFSILVFGGAVFALYTMEKGPKGRDLAIVTGKGIEARLATADSASSILALPPGSEIKILSERGDWIYAALPNDLRGWIPAKSAERVRLDTPSS